MGTLAPLFFSVRHISVNLTPVPRGCPVHIAPVAKASLCGFGIEGYALAIEGLAAMIDARQKG